MLQRHLMKSLILLCQVCFARDYTRKILRLDIYWK